MKKSILHFLLFLVLPIAGMAQAKPVKIVFDITSNDSLAHQAVLRHVTGMSKSYPDSKFEVVVYGGALPMVVKNKSTVANSIQQLGGNKNVSFKVCAVTMQRFAVDQSQLLPTIQVVPDAIMEIVTRQAEGWGYIKEAHH
jgi:intracellular sulfur oxidation DsrE/DsrF family protein